MKVTRWGEYGILCSLYLARTSAAAPVGAAEIAEAQGIPLQYAQQILHRLRKGGVVTSVRGPHGGFRLARPAVEVSLKDILYAAEGDTFEVVCDANPVHHNCHDEDRDCGLRGVWQELKRAIDHVLEQRSLADLIERELASGKSTMFEPIVPIRSRARRTAHNQSEERPAASDAQQSSRSAAPRSAAERESDEAQPTRAVER